jgi:hypothetical protein
MKIKNELKGCKERGRVLPSEQNIKSSTLLINALFTTHHCIFRKLPWLSGILPINHFVRLRLYFKNLYETEIKEQEVNFWILYPDGKQYRSWYIKIPQLNHKDDCYWSEIDILFKPEVPGIHRLVFEKLEGIQYADFHGMVGRPYKQIDAEWTTSFNIYSPLELGSYLVAIVALVVASLSCIISILSFFKPC